MKTSVAAATETAVLSKSGRSKFLCSLYVSWRKNTEHACGMTFYISEMGLTSVVVMGMLGHSQWKVLGTIEYKAVINESCCKGIFFLFVYVHVCVYLCVYTCM